MATIVTTKKSKSPNGTRITELVHEEIVSEPETAEEVMTAREKRDAVAKEKAEVAKAAKAAAKAAKK